MRPLLLRSDVHVKPCTNLCITIHIRDCLSYNFRSLFCIPEVFRHKGIIFQLIDHDPWCSLRRNPFFPRYTHCFRRVMSNRLVAEVINKYYHPWICCMNSQQILRQKKPNMKHTYLGFALETRFLSLTSPHCFSYPSNFFVLWHLLASFLDDLWLSDFLFDLAVKKDGDKYERILLKSDRQIE